MSWLPRDSALAVDEPPDEVYLTEDDTDLERMHMALSEVGLAPDDGGGGWFGWNRPLTQDEYDLVVRAEQLSGSEPVS